MHWQPIARILFNTVGSVLVAYGVLPETEAAQYGPNDVSVALAGVVCVGVQYIGYYVAVKTGRVT